jgi:ATP-binding cassette subfamily F protein 3
MLLKPSNFLIMDEPTNHLDMNSKYVLMNALKEYHGTMLIISHDREFLDGIVNKIIEMEDKKIRKYTGTCSDYITKKREEELQQSDGKRMKYKMEGDESKLQKIKEKKRQEAETRNKIYRLSKPYRDKITIVENEIKLRENRLLCLETEMTSESFYKNSEKVKNANKEIKELKKDLDNLYHEWMNCSNKLIEIESALTAPEKIK